MKRAETLVILGRIADRGGGVVTLRQAVAAGVPAKVMGAVVRSGFYRRAYPGVFVRASEAGRPLTDLRAAVAALGPQAAASHRSAARLHRLVDRDPQRPQITVVSASSRCLAGVEVHRSVEPIPVRTVQGVRCTPVARTLVDLAAVATASELESAVDRALAEGRTRMRELGAELGRSRRRGAAVLRRCLAGRGDIGRPDASVLEAKMARLLVRYGLPAPRCEVLAGEGGRYRIDFAYPDRKLAIEVNGYAWHHTPEQMIADQARQRALVLRGWTVLVYGWRDVLYDSDRVAAEIAAGYARCGR